jgi:hypothetical protein
VPAGTKLAASSPLVVPESAAQQTADIELVIRRVLHAYT